MLSRPDRSNPHRQRPNFRFLFDIAIPAMFSAMMILISCIAFASLIFSGRASEFLGVGISLLVSGSVIVGVLYGWSSEYRMLVVQPDDDTAPIYAAMVAGLGFALPAAISNEAFFWHVILLILLSTLLTGLALVVLGQLNAGASIEFLPYSVMGGYFATAGWLLTIGGVKAGTNIELTYFWQMPPIYGVELAMLVATCMFALFLFSVREHRLKNLFLVLALFLGVGLFYLSTSIFSEQLPTDIVDRVTLGDLQKDAAGADYAPGMLLSAFAAISEHDYSQLRISLPSLSIIVLLSCVSTLLTISGLNLLLQHDAQPNRELRRVGAANMAGGLVGGMAAFPSVSLTSLAKSMGAPTTRWFGLATVLFLLLLAYFGMAWVGYIPKPVIGGMLLSMGLGFLYEWLVQARSRYLLHEYLVIPVILLVAIFFGFLQGVLVGLLAATILFVIKYSQTQVIRFEGDGRRFRSNVDRSGQQLEVLQRHGKKILVIGLQGYLFFGTSGRIYSRVKDLLESDSEIEVVLLDFEKVSGVDASAGLNFDKLAQLVTLRQVHMLIAGLERSLVGNLSSTGIDMQSVGYARIFDDIDRALEWHEERLITAAEQDQEKSGTFVAQLGSEDVEALAQFTAYLKRIEVDAGHVLAEQGDQSDELYLLESCGASAYIEDGNGGRLRVRRVASGAIYGEIGFYLGTPRTASIVTDDAGAVYILTREQYQAMEHEAPELIARFQRYLLGVSIERLLFTTQTLSTVMR